MSLQDFVELAALLRQQVANRPLLLFAATLTLFALLDRRAAPPRNLSTATMVAAAATGIYLAVVIWYATEHAYADAAEPTMAVVAALFQAGQPVYHAVDAAERYSHIYGPLAFVLPGWWMMLTGSTIIASKSLGAAAALSSVAVVFALTHRRDAPRTAVIATGLFCGLCLAFQQVSFWNRPDSLELLVAGAALLAAVRARHGLAAAVLVGGLTGILADLKMTGPLYALPAYAVLVSRRQAVFLPLAAVVAVIVAALPFVAFPNVSFANYLTWVRASAGNGLLLSTLKQNLEWSLFLLLPLVPGLLPIAPRSNRWVTVAICAGVAFVAIAASKPGAGPYHLMPFIPAILFAAALAVDSTTVNDRSVRLGIKSFAVTCAIVAGLQVINLLSVTTRTPASRLAADVEAFLDSQPATRVEMGYSTEDESFAYVRPVIVFRQRRHLFDAPAIQEYQLSGLSLPDASVRAIERCDVDAWLFAKGGRPFSLRNRYPRTAHVPLFPDVVREIFDRAYVRSASTEYFDVWTCRQPRR